MSTDVLKQNIEGITIEGHQAFTQEQAGQTVLGYFPNYTSLYSLFQDHHCIHLVISTNVEPKMGYSTISHTSMPLQSTHFLENPAGH